MRSVFCWALFVAVCVTACSKALLDKDEFTALLIDMHSADGMLVELDQRRDDPKVDYMASPAPISTVVSATTPAARKSSTPFTPR